MRYARYLRLAGTCSILLGLIVAALALPGLFLHYAAWWAAVLFVPGLVLAVGGNANRHGVPFGDPGRWLTEGPMARARPGREVLPAAALERQLLGEAATWIVACAAWIVLVGTGGVFFFGAGLASIAYGSVQLFAAAPRIEYEERRRQTRIRIHHRPHFRAPILTV